MNRTLKEQLEFAKVARMNAIDTLRQTIADFDNYETYYDAHTTTLLSAQLSDIKTLNSKIDTLYAELDREIKKEEKEF